MGAVNGLLSSAYVELLENVVHMVLDGAQGYAQPLGDLLVEAAGCDQAQNLFLPEAQTIRSCGAGPIPCLYQTPQAR